MNDLLTQRLGYTLLAIATGWSAVATAREEGPIYFSSDVVPVLTKLGCNSGACHGKATGQNGFKLSLLGFEPELDFRAIAHEARGRRLSPAFPDQSLLLMKATSRTPHGGGRRLERDSEDYRMLRNWITNGVAPPRASDPQIMRIDLAPNELVLTPESNQQLHVTAHFSNGVSRDVTRQAVYESNEPNIAEVGKNGLIETNEQTGLFAVMVRFGGKVATFHAAVPQTGDEKQQTLVQSQLEQLERELDSSFDQLLFQQWKRLVIAPSAPADDATFVRRATIDICGTLPTRQEVEAYVADTGTDKRARLIDRLLEKPEYASYFALKWAEILQNRGSGYSTSKQRPGTTLFARWIRDSIAANKPYDQ
ncbi:MAG: DUF1549 domain-containing protein, partial [Pirellulaceae bacterium]